jgi:hypothetical protein
LKNNTILAIAFLLAGTLLTAATTAMAPAYAGGDGNKQKVEDESAGSIADCDKNEVTQADFECIAAAATEEGVITGPEPEPEPEPETCEECFEELLTEEEITAVEEGVGLSLEEICNELELGVSEDDLRDVLTSAGIDEETQDALIECLEAVGIVVETNNIE